jgi:hypothetical protein
MRPALSEATVERLDHALASMPRHRGMPTDDVCDDARGDVAAQGDGEPATGDGRDDKVPADVDK